MAGLPRMLPAQTGFSRQNADLLRSGAGRVREAIEAKEWEQAKSALDAMQRNLAEGYVLLKGRTTPKQNQSRPIHSQTEALLAVRRLEAVVDGTQRSEALRLAVDLSDYIRQQIAGGSSAGTAPTAGTRQDAIDAALIDQVWTRYQEGDLLHAAEVNQKLLPLAADAAATAPNAARAKHIAHTVAGLLAYGRGDLGAAKTELLASADLAIPAIDFEPKMTLAKKLIEGGEKETVIAYLDRCRTFWHSEEASQLLTEWSQAALAGRTPDFPERLLN